MYKNPEDLAYKIKEYFGSLRIEGHDDVPATITGLAFYLGFESRQSFYDYEKKEDFSYIIRRARLMVECEYEKKLSGNSPTGSIFALKNMGWSDRQEIAHSGLPDPAITVTIAKPEDE